MSSGVVQESWWKRWRIMYLLGSAILSHLRHPCIPHICLLTPPASIRPDLPGSTLSPPPTIVLPFPHLIPVPLRISQCPRRRDICTSGSRRSIRVQKMLRVFCQKGRLIFCAESRECERLSSGRVLRFMCTHLALHLSFLPHPPGHRAYDSQTNDGSCDT